MKLLTIVLGLYERVIRTPLALVGLRDALWKASIWVRSYQVHDVGFEKNDRLIEA